MSTCQVDDLLPSVADAVRSRPGYRTVSSACRIEAITSCPAIPIVDSTLELLLGKRLGTIVYLRHDEICLFKYAPIHIVSNRAETDNRHPETELSPIGFIGVGCNARLRQIEQFSYPGSIAIECALDIKDDPLSADQLRGSDHFTDLILKATHLAPLILG